MKTAAYRFLALAGLSALVGCSNVEVARQYASTPGKVACDSFFIYDMCVRDISGDGLADFVWFTDTNEVFMYREGMKEAAASVAPMHRCAREMEPTTVNAASQAFNRENLTFMQEAAAKRQLALDYASAKSEVDECMARTMTGAPELQEEQDDFFMDEFDWDEGEPAVASGSVGD